MPKTQLDIKIGATLDPADVKRAAQQIENALDDIKLELPPDSIKRAASEADKLTQSISKAESKAGQLDKDFDGASKAAAKTANETEDIIKNMDKVGASASELVANFKKASAEASGIGDSLSKATEKSGGFFSSLSGMGKGAVLAGGALAVGAGLFQIAESADEANASLLKLQAATGLTNEEFERLKTASVEAFKQGLGESIAEANEIMGKATNLLSAAFDAQGVKDTTAEVQKFAVGAQKLASVFDVDVNEVIAKSQSLITNFGLDAEEAFNLVAYGMQNSANADDDFLDTIKEYSPLMKQAGLSAEEFVYLLNKGIAEGAYNTDKLADAIKETQIRVKAGDYMKAFEGLDGVVAQQIQGLAAAAEAGQISMVDLLNRSGDIIQEQVDSGKITKAMQDKINVAIAGTLAEEQGELFNKIFNSDNLDENEIKEAAKKAGDLISENMAPAGFDGLKRAFEVTLNDLSNSLTPALAPIFNTLSNDLIPALSPIFKELAPLLKTVFEGLGPIIQELGSALVPLLGGAVDLITPLIAPLLQLVQDILPPVLSLLDPIVAIMPELGKLIGEILAVITPLISQLVGDFAPILSDVISNLLPPMVDLFKASIPIIQALTNIISSLASIIGDSASPAVAELSDKMKTVIETATWLVTAVVDVGDAVVSAVDSISPMGGAIERVMAEAKASTDATDFSIKQIAISAKEVADEINKAAERAQMLNAYQKAVNEGKILDVLDWNSWSKFKADVKSNPVKPVVNPSGTQSATDESLDIIKKYIEESKALLNKQSEEQIAIAGETQKTLEDIELSRLRRNVDAVRELTFASEAEKAGAIYDAQLYLIDQTNKIDDARRARDIEEEKKAAAESIQIQIDKNNELLKDAKIASEKYAAERFALELENEKLQRQQLDIVAELEREAKAKSLLAEEEHLAERSKLYQEYYANLIKMQDEQLQADIDGLIEHIDKTAEATAESGQAWFDFFSSVANETAKATANQEAFVKSLTLSLLNALEAQIPIYIAKIYAEEIASKSFLGIATASGLTATLLGLVELAKGAVAGKFAEGGFNPFVTGYSGLVEGRNRFIMVNEGPVAGPEFIMKPSVTAKNAKEFEELNRMDVSLWEYIRMKTGMVLRGDRAAGVVMVNDNAELIAEIRDLKKEVKRLGAKQSFGRVAHEVELNFKSDFADVIKIKNNRELRRL